MSIFDTSADEYSEVYMRDHLFIKFMKGYVKEHAVINIDKTYERWLEWLRNMEAQYDERSKV